MAQWNNNITTLEWIIIGFNASLLIIYSIFIARTAKQLHQNKKKVDSFVLVTLILIGVSIIFLLLQTVDIMFFADEEEISNTMYFLYAFLG